MKKLFVFMLAIMLVVAFTVPASALTNKFGGYWRTRFVSYGNLNGRDVAGTDFTQVNTRTRLYYTAILHDNLKFVNKFEFDAVWGGKGSDYGAIGADGKVFEVKNTYADFNALNLNWVIGTQGFQWGRSGFLFDDDATGMKIIYRGADNFIPALYWVRAYDGDTQGDDGMDYDYYTALVNIKSGNMQIVPYISYMTSNSGGSTAGGTGFEIDQDPTSATYGTLVPIAASASSNINPGGIEGQAQDLYYIGLDFNMKFDMWSFMATGIYNGGDVNDTMDVSAYLLDFAAKVKLGGFGIHGEAMYATGDDNTDTTVDAFIAPAGASYSWSEGYARGSIDTKGFVAGTPVFPGTGKNANAKAISDMMNFNLGTTFATGKSLKWKIDWWNINLAEDDAVGNKDIGNELSVKATWKVIKNLDLLMVGAYMIAGDAFYAGTDDANPYELAAQLSLKF